MRVLRVRKSTNRILSLCATRTCIVTLCCDVNSCEHTEQENVLVLISGGVLTAESTPSFAEACFCFSSDPMSFIFLISCLRNWCTSKAWHDWNTFLQGEQENDSDIGSSGTSQRGSDLDSENNDTI